MATDTNLNSSNRRVGENHDITHIVNTVESFDTVATGWILTHADEFDDKATAIAKGADPACFSKAPTCMINWWARKDCPEFATELADLNKCNWDVYNYYNYMDWDAPEGTGINAFHPTQVKVENGNLILGAEKSFYSNLSCKNKFKDPRTGYDSFTTQCPIISGGVESRRHGPDNKFGFTQKFGRFEVRAKLNHGPGSWPAHWLLPEKGEPGCGWPYSGEIDIMEATFLHKGEAGANYHTGDCAKKSHVSGAFLWEITDEFYPGKTAEQKENSFYDEFHTYVVEWDEKQMRFLYDDHFIGQYNAGDILINGSTGPEGHKIDIPQERFYWLLNNTIFNAGDPSKVDTANFVRQEHIIDYIRVYRKCVAGDPAAKCVSFDYKNTNAKCPGLRSDIGDYKSKNLCKGWPHFSISEGKCRNKGGEIASITSGDYAGQWCALNEGKWYKARKISHECPWPKEHIGDKGYFPVCKQWPHFKIKSSNCDGETWNASNGKEYCIWNETGWFKARQTK